MSQLHLCLFFCISQSKFGKIELCPSSSPKPWKFLPEVFNEPFFLAKQEVVINVTSFLYCLICLILTCKAFSLRRVVLRRSKGARP